MRRRSPVVTAVRSEQLTVCRVRYGPELYGKIFRIDDDPATLFVGGCAPARTGDEGGRGDVRTGGVLVGASDLATYTVGPAEHSWARTISNRRLLVCKAAVKASAWSHSAALIPICRGHESQMCPHVQRFTARCCALLLPRSSPGRGCLPACCRSRAMRTSHTPGQQSQGSGSHTSAMI